MSRGRIEFIIATICCFSMLLLLTSAKPPGTLKIACVVALIVGLTLYGHLLHRWAEGSGPTGSQDVEALGTMPGGQVIPGQAVLPRDADPN
jgi:hypothetical protein